MSTIFKVRRGDIFICVQKTINSGSVENKTRPVVVVSNDKGNTSSTTCTVCPITTRDKTVIPSQVMYHYEGKNQVILCEQIKTVSISDLTQFVGYLNDDIMDKVDTALKIQLGLDKKEYSIDKALSFIEDTFTKVLRMKQVEAKDTISERELEDVALRIAQTVEDLVMPINNSIIQNTPVDKTETKQETKAIEKTDKPPIKTKSQIDKFNSRLKKTIDKNHNDSIDDSTVINSGKGKYFNTIGDVKKFLKDCDELPTYKVADIWHMTPDVVYNQKYLCKKKYNL